MKILFVHLGREHIGIEYLSAVLKKAGHETELAVDIGLFGQNDNIFYIPRLEKRMDLAAAIVRKFIDYNPGLVCFSAYSTTLKWCFSIAEMIREQRVVPTLIGGNHITLVPESAMLCSAIDYGFRGEAEETICELVSRIENGSSVDDIPGLIFRRGDDIVVNDPPPLVEDLDSLPFPDKSLFEHVLNISDDYMTLASRGCYYNCSFCCEHVNKKMYGSSFQRLRRVDALIEEFLVMKRRYNYSEVYIVSPFFPEKMDWVADFSEKYSTKIGKPFWCFGHVNNFTMEYATLLKEAGCRNVEFGIQSLNEDIRRKVLHRGESNEKLREVIDVCDRVGLGYDFDIIFHLPGESEADYKEAVNLFSSCRKIHRIKTYYLTIFPRTDIAYYSMKNGYLDEATHRAMECGEVGDFVHIPSVEARVEKWKIESYEKQLKLITLLPLGARQFLNRPWAVKAVSSIPGIVIKTLEMMKMIIRKDLRLLLYLKIYGRHITQFITGRRKP